MRRMTDLDSQIASTATLRSRVVIGHTTESEVLEFKRAYNHVDADPQGEVAREAARDIVSFANTWGGTIVVGVREGAAVLPSSYRIAGEPVGVQDPDAVKQWIEKRVRGFIVPSTLALNVAIVEWEVAVPMVAINVSPDVTGTVAVWHPGTERMMEFLVRTSLGKRYLTPTDVSARMSRSTRAVQITLRRLRAQAPQDRANAILVSLSSILDRRPTTSGRCESKRSALNVVDLAYA